MVKKSISEIKILGVLRTLYPEFGIALKFENTWQLLVSTILSAQCTDRQVNKVTPVLFKKLKTIDDFAKTDLKKLETMVKSTGFYKNKAKNIKNSAKMVLKRYNGYVPKTMKELTELPGVARKTANIVLHSGFGLIEGIAVDTHVKRLSKRIGLTKEENPVNIEKDLMKIFPKRYWGDVSFLLIMHGRNVCKARKPDCNNCLLCRFCISCGKMAKK